MKDISYFVMTPITSHGKVVAALRKVGTHGTYHRHLGLISGTYLNLRYKFRLIVILLEIPRKPRRALPDFVPPDGAVRRAHTPLNSAP